MASSRFEADRSLDSHEAVRILVVDDRREDLLALCEILRHPDYVVVSAQSGNEALKHLLEGEFAVILLDVIMPTLDGFELATLIKQRERCSHTPIVFLTAAGVDVSRLYRAYSVGAIDYLVKPVDAEVVRAKIAVFADLFRKDRSLRLQALMLRESERRERELQVAQLQTAAERRYRNLAEAIPQIVWTTDPSGALDYCNRRWVEYTGLSLERTREAGWFQAVHPEDVESCERVFRESLQTGVKFEMECRLRRSSDGAYRWHLCRALPERDDQGRIVAWLGTHADFEELIQAIRARDVFLSIASHELRTPLTALKLRIQGLQQDREISEETRRRVNIVARQGERMERLVDSLLDVARITAGQLCLETEEFSVGDVACDVVERFQANAAPGQAKIGLERRAEVSGRWDRLRVEQVITNLLTNAIIYGEGKPVQVSVDATAEGAEICVTDQGNGIAPDDHARIFDRFGRAGGPRAKGGLGMGLFISQQIAEAHGGAIRVESQLGKGARFVVTLPVVNLPD